jgi:uncharacterized protein YecT (DUF1311 family)
MLVMVNTRTTPYEGTSMKVFDTFRPNRSGWCAKLALTLGCLFAQGAAHSASFNCAQAKTKVEQLICDDDELFKLDSRMATRYAQALASQPNTQQLKEQQRTWLRDRNACSTTDCLKRAYANNPFMLQSRPRFGQCEDVHPDIPMQCGLYLGKGEAACEVYLKHLNELKETPNCRIPQPPQFKSLEWQELDVLEHLDWAYQIDIHHRAPAGWRTSEWRRSTLPMERSGARLMWRSDKWVRAGRITSVVCLMWLTR